MERLSAFEMSSSGKSLVEDIAKKDAFIRVVAWGMKTVANKQGQAIAILTVADSEGLLYSTRSAGLVTQWEAMCQDSEFTAKPYADFKITQSNPFDVVTADGRSEKGKTWHWNYIRPVYCDTDMALTGQPNLLELSEEYPKIAQNSLYGKLNEEGEDVNSPTD